MVQKEDAAALRRRFTAQYRLAGSDLIREIERATCGCDYGATSWTTREEAGRVGELLELGPGKRLLDIGAGSGWPGLYLASQTGCDVALSDLPMEGLRHAALRAAVDRPAGACFFAAADGAALPYRSGWFDAVSHSDVLCCLEAKQSVLKECRRVIRPGGTMVFTVISIVPDLPPGDRARAGDFGPVFIETDTAYPELLRRTGWEILDSFDLTAVFGRSIQAVLEKELANMDGLRELLGEDALSEKLGRRRRTLEGVEKGLIRREMFVTSAAAPD